MKPKPSEVKISMTVLDWKKTIGYLKAFAVQPSNSQWEKWAYEIVEKIKSLTTTGISDQLEMPVTLKPSAWKGVQAVLKPASKNDSDYQKELLVQQIENALNLARQSILVTTGDIKENYEIVGPVYFQVSNKGVFNNQVTQLTNEYRNEIAQMRSLGQIGAYKKDWGYLYGEWTAGQTVFEQTFYIAVQELKRRTLLLDADCVVAMRQDIDLDTTGFQYFYLQMYGTAVRYIDNFVIQ